MTRVAFYGGSFNPPHVAHVLACAYLLSAMEVDHVLVVPVFRHAFEKPLAPFEHRVEMCRRAVAWLPGVEVSAVESELETPSLTLRTLEHLRARHPDWSLRLVVGSDVLFEARKWHAFERICQIAPPLVLGRVGYPHADAPVAVLPEVSSTRIRELVASESEKELAHLLPRSVLAYVLEQGLYR